MSVNGLVTALCLFACISIIHVMPFHGAASPTGESWICMMRMLVTWTAVNREKIFLWHCGIHLLASTAAWKKDKVWNVNCFIEGKTPKMQFYISVVFTAMWCWNVYFCKFTFKAFFFPHWENVRINPLLADCKSLSVSEWSAYAKTQHESALFSSFRVLFTLRVSVETKLNCFLLLVVSHVKAVTPSWWLVVGECLSG